MFKLVGVQDSLFAILDTDDDFIDVLPKSKVCKCLNLGIQIGGVSRVSSSEFDYTDEFFPCKNIEEEEDDYYLDDEEEDYEEDDVEEDKVSTVNKLYSFLNEEQIKLLKRYYLWFSQRIFDEGKKQKRVLQITNNPRKLKKQKELNAMRNQGGMWAYAGFIDMGYRGADYCTLGHPLRYVHLAWDISVSDIETSFFGEEYSNDIDSVINSSNCIKFGIDCISDFFEIDKEYTDRLKRAQREAIKDMDIMCEYYVSNIADEVISSFTVMDEIISHTSKVDAKGMLLKGNDYKCLIPKGFTSFYTQFRKAGVVVPKSLIQEIRDNLIGWGEHKFIGWRYPNYDILGNVIKSVVGRSASSMASCLSPYSYNYIGIISKYLSEFFQLKSCGYYEYDADRFKDEGGASKQVKSQLYGILSDVDSNFWSDVEYTFDYIKKVVESYNMISSVKDILESYNTSSYAYSVSSCKYYIDTEIKQLDFDMLRKYNSDLYELVDELKGLERTRYYRLCRGISLSQFLSDFSAKLNRLTSELDNYKDFAESKVKESVDLLNKEKEDNLEQSKKAKEEEERLKNLSDDEIREYCILNSGKVKDNSKLKFALTVLDTVKKTGRCSDKQMSYIGLIYKELTGVQIEDKRKSDKTSLDDRKDIEDAIDSIISNPDLLNNEDNKEKVLAILNSIKKYRSISERQMKYAEIALDAVKEI